MNKRSYKGDVKMDKVVNEVIVNKVAAALPEEEILYDVAELFKVFGDSDRKSVV